jgi:hypothetical protein
MISIKYSNESILVETGDLSALMSDQFPLTIKFLRNVSDRVVWHTQLGSNGWASFQDSEMMDVLIEDAKGMLLSRHRWDPFMNGSVFYQTLWNYSLRRKLEGKTNKGLAVGTHSGEFGEWVPLAQNLLSDIILVEGSSKQYEGLLRNFPTSPHLTFINEIVTPDGGEVVFYEGGEGYTNSVLKRVIEYWESAPITETRRNSLKFNELVTPDINWLHLDVEGIDDKLIMSLDANKFDHLDIIIFEYNNLSEEERKCIDDFMKDKGYSTYRERGICLASK